MTTEFKATVAHVIKLEDQIKDLEGKVEAATKKQMDKIKHHQGEIDKLMEAADKVAKPFNDSMSSLEAEIYEDKKEIAKTMTEIEEKTIDLDIAKVQMKTTKSVKVLDKTALVNALSGLKGGIEKGVKTFALPYIRKLMEVDEELLEDIAAFEEKNTVYITKAEEVKTDG